jgi:hypothetical protein
MVFIIERRNGGEHLVK